MCFVGNKLLVQMNCDSLYPVWVPRGSCCATVPMGSGFSLQTTDLFVSKHMRVCSDPCIAVLIDCCEGFTCMIPDMRVRHEFHSCNRVIAVPHLLVCQYSTYNCPSTFANRTHMPQCAHHSSTVNYNASGGNNKLARRLRTLQRLEGMVENKSCSTNYGTNEDVQWRLGGISKGVIIGLTSTMGIAPSGRTAQMLGVH